MISRGDIFRSAVCATIGGIIAVLVLKFLEKKKETAVQGEFREEDDLNETEKQPQENDERLN